MTNIDKLINAYGKRIIKISARDDIPRNTRLVYILFCDDDALVVGEGEYNRARVVLDDLINITPNHKKAIKVRLYILYGKQDSIFSPFIILCDSKEEAQEIEKKLHRLIGGNDSKVAPEILNDLFNGIMEDSIERLFLNLALCSAFDGISDLKKWRRQKIIKDSIWGKLCKILKLTYRMPDS